MRLEGQFCSLRLVEVEDAEFIVALRTDKKKSQFLSKTDASVEKQIEWIKRYKTRECEESEFYFIIEDQIGQPVGTYRLYDIESESATPGSWILVDGVDLSLTIESVLLMYAFVFNSLEKSKIIFDVMKSNKRVIRFHQSYGSICTQEKQDLKYFEFTSELFPEMKVRMGKYIGLKDA
ncbi:TPA: GNAT family N-acetyltransferase [Vibrio vulnificus]|nr:GNAT family N-acetyltransferase [Vibrio vulnificus]